MEPQEGSKKTNHPSPPLLVAIRLAGCEAAAVQKSQVHSSPAKIGALYTRACGSGDREPRASKGLRANLGLPPLPSLPAQYKHISDENGPFMHLARFDPKGPRNYAGAVHRPMAFPLALRHLYIWVLFCRNLWCPFGFPKKKTPLHMLGHLCALSDEPIQLAADAQQFT